MVHQVLPELQGKLDYKGLRDPQVQQALMDNLAHQVTLVRKDPLVNPGL